MSYKVFKFDGHEFRLRFNRRSGTFEVEILPFLYLAYHARRGDAIASHLLASAGHSIWDANGHIYWPMEAGYSPKDITIIPLPVDGRHMMVLSGFSTDDSEAFMNSYQAFQSQDEGHILVVTLPDSNKKIQFVSLVDISQTPEAVTDLYQYLVGIKCPLCQEAIQDDEVDDLIILGYTGDMNHVPCHGQCWTEQVTIMDFTIVLDGGEYELRSES